jgi:uncharacterized membrane protein
MSITVVCIAHDDSTAQRIIHAVRESGIPSQDVSVLLNDPASTTAFAYQTHTKASEGAATGASTGGVLGGVVGWLVGIGTLAIPGVGPFIAAGPILAALGGAAIGAAIGSIAGTLVGLGIPEVEAKRYEGRIRDGGILISITAADSQAAKRVRTVLRDSGADDITTTLHSPPTPTGNAKISERSRAAAGAITVRDNDRSVHS